MITNLITSLAVLFILGGGGRFTSAQFEEVD